MRKVGAFIVKFRYWLLGLFIILTGASIILMQKVNINYNLMQYLDKDSTSTVALETMEDEFGSIGQCQVMITNIEFDKANEVKDKIEKVEGVASIVFAKNEDDRDYYNNETHDALYKVFLTTSNFDVETYNTLDRIRAELNEYTLALNGGSVDAEFLTKSLADDMVIILIVTVVVVFIILMLTSSSYFEPIVFLIVAGGAILINLGTNVLLNWIPYIGNSMSFITKSIAAVMQLALSMDYAIVLLHTYKEEKLKYDNNYDAMSSAIARAFAPVSASSITTIAGLVALMFMSFSIGFDVGLVLAKGILISLLSVFLFMPALLILFDKLIVKTAHRPIYTIVGERLNKYNHKRKEKGKKVFSVSKFQRKTKYLIPILALIVIAVGTIFNFKCDYSFTLKASTDETSTVNVDNDKISNEFGTQNTLVVLLEKKDKSKEQLKQEEENIINYLKNYKYKDKNVITSAQGYTSYGVYNDVTATEFATIYLDSETHNANVRAMETLYSYMLNDGIAYMDGDSIKCNVYEILKYATNNNGADKITRETQELINKINVIYKLKLTKELFAKANDLDLSLVTNVYNAMGVETASVYEVLKFINDNNYAALAMSNIQQQINSKYSDLVTNNVFDTNGNVNTTTIGLMKAYCEGVEADPTKLDDQATKETYTNYKAILNEFNLESLISTYPFITNEVAEALLGDNETIPNYLVIQAVSVNDIANNYGIGLQNTISEKYNEIPAKDEIITKEYARYNYGVDNNTLDSIFNDGNVTNGDLISALSTKNYFRTDEYVNALQSKFSDSYKAFNNFESENYIRIIFNFDMPITGEDSFKSVNEINEGLNQFDDTKLVCETFVYSQIKDVYNNDIITVNIISFVAILLIIAITFKSYFVPILLTLLIQGAIWITMGISTMIGNNIFFICYIVVMCVQMGATIDYGILLTNNYIENRKKYGVYDSISYALKSSLPTIITSGSILVLATLIIGIVSKVTIVSDLGLLLSRGCLISVIMILLVLPQFLILLDKVIEKTSFKTTFYHGEDLLLEDNSESNNNEENDNNEAEIEVKEDIEAKNDNNLESNSNEEVKKD